MNARERLYLNADRTQILPDGHVDAAFLYAVPGDEIPQSAADKFGLVDGRLPAPAARKAAGKSKPETKDKPPGENKEKSAGDGKAGADNGQGEQGK